MKIRMSCGIGYVNAEHHTEIEVPDYLLEGMSEEEKSDYIYEEYLIPFANEHLDMWYEEIED